MSYSTSLPGVGEATRDAIKALIVSGITGMNAALAVGGLTPMTLTAAQVVLGDAQAFDTSRISIVGGGERDATDMEMEAEFAPLTDTAGYKETISTNIYVYLSDEEMMEDGLTPEQHMERMERARQRICDHIRRRIFNDPVNVVLTLASREHCVAPAYDLMKTTYISQITMGYTPKGYGGTKDVLSAHLIHRGEML